MLKVNLKEEASNESRCFICHKTFQKGDETKKIFDKAFDTSVRVCKGHFFYEEKEGNKESAI